MRFWWVNHKQTYRQEIGGGYIWSPKVKKGGGRNRFYDSMRLVVPGDVIVSYASGRIRQFGVATRTAASCPKPAEFGQSGVNWGQDGWMVPVDWRALPSPIVPKQLLPELRNLLPPKFSPIRVENGYGNQNVYLAAIPDALVSRSRNS